MTSIIIIHLMECGCSYDNDVSPARYEECKTKLTPFLKKVGFNPKTGIHDVHVHVVLAWGY